MSTFQNLVRGSARSLLVAVLVLVIVLSTVAPAYAAPPANDDFDSAVEIQSIPFSFIQDTTEATAADDDPEACAQTGHTVWYEVTLTSPAELEADTFGSDYDTLLAVYIGARGTLLEIGCNDDFGSGKQSRLRWNAQPGISYYIMAAGVEDAAGLLDFDLNTAPAPVELALSYDPTEWVNSISGRPVITGTLDCSTQQSGVIVQIEVTQRVQGKQIRGSGSTQVDCSGPTRWLIDVSTRDNAHFTWGRVGIDGEAFEHRQGAETHRSDTALLVPCSRIGTLRDDQLKGTPDRDQVCGLDGNDRISGRGGDDTIRGGYGDDTLVAHDGNDVLFGGDGADEMFGSAGNDKLDGAEGDDVMNGGAGNDRCFGGPGNNRSVSC
ncbi:MAG: calcium-binding protein [Actinomycetota bacterium]